MTTSTSEPQIYVKCVKGSDFATRDRSAPVFTSVFTELYDLLEGLRRKPEAQNQIAASRMSAAYDLCQAGRVEDAFAELQALIRDLSSDNKLAIARTL